MDGAECKERILSQDAWDFIVPNTRNIDELGTDADQLCIQFMDFDYKAIYMDSAGLEPLTIDRYWYNSIPNCYALLDITALNEAGITAVQNYPTLQLMGQNVLIGFMDTGIEYTNDVFKSLDGRTRIAGIWDQTIQDGTPPPGFLYGSEYTQDMIDEALRSDNPLDIVPSTDTDGHGTYLASVAAGSANVENRFIGAAPESTIAVVKLKPAKDYLKKFYAIREDAPCFQENDIMLGLKYLNELSVRMNMPVVMCISLGTSFGGHNDTSLLSSVLNSYASVRNRMVVIGGGNEANQRHHYSAKITSMTDIKEVEIRVGSQVEGFVTELWTFIPNVMTVSIVSPSGERISRISIRQGSLYTYSFTFDRTIVEAEYRLLLENNDSQLIFLRFTTPAEGIWKIIVEPLQLASGIFHMWLPVQEFLTGDVYFLEGNPENTITEPASTQRAMTVSYYNGVDNSIDINSGRGYTRNDIIKPDFAAPGVQVTGAGLNNRFITKTGSSVAVGITAGAVALLVEWVTGQPGGTNVSTSQIRNLIVLGAGKKPLLTYPNREWGYGTLDLYQALDILRRL